MLIYVRKVYGISGIIARFIKLKDVSLFPRKLILKKQETLRPYSIFMYSSFPCIQSPKSVEYIEKTILSKYTCTLDFITDNF